MGELKPCPLCDGQAKLCHGLPSTQNRGTYQAFVRCKKCGCKTKTFFQAAYESKADVDKAAKDSWNLRVARENNPITVLRCQDCINSEPFNGQLICSRYGGIWEENDGCTQGSHKPEGSEKA